MSPSDFDLLSALVRKRSGIVLSSDKSYLVASRLNPVAERHAFASIEAMVRAMREGGGGAVENDIVEAMANNESYFFRDRKPFEGLEEEILPFFLKARASARRLRIWSAAASSGQEPYTLAIQLKEAGGLLHGWRIEIVATDMCGEILEKAKAGLYSQFEVQRGLPIKLLIKYFEKEGEMWRVDPAIRAMVEFRRFNLLEPMTALGRFDVVFCRNVLIYFDRETKIDVLERIACQMAPDGVLVLGAAETAVGLTDAFEPMPGQRGFFRPAGAAAQNGARAAAGERA